MGDFVLYKKNNLDKEKLDKVTEVLRKQGSINPVIVEHDQYVMHFYPKVYSKVFNCLKVSESDYCGTSGTFFYKDMFGEVALRSFFDGFDINHLDYEDFTGIYTVIINKDGRLFLLTDPMGCSRVYHNQDKTIWSSSFLAVSSACNNLTPNRQAIYEYVFQETTYGTDTVFNEVSTLDSHYMVELLPEGVNFIRKQLEFDLTPSVNTYSDELNNNINILTEEFAKIVNNFDDNITTALSGGYDSRLILSLLSAKGCKPEVYVYGDESSSDVRVAQNIANGENFELKHIDKSKYEKTNVSEYLEIINNNYYILDGFPTEGIFDFGANVDTRINRAKNGYLLLNGGGGEIYRNFYNLPNISNTGQKFTVLDLIRTFYSRHSLSICQDGFSLRDYRELLRLKIKQALGLDSDRLSRSQLEFAYPAFRLRYWTSKDNSNNTRLGSFVTPFISYNTIKAAVRIPLKFKNHGRIQAGMINGINKQLAAYVSDYGYSFNHEIPLKNKIKDILIYRRPVILRQYSYAIQHSMRKLETPKELEINYLREAVDLNDLIMSQFFKIDKINDPHLLSRVYTLEYLFRSH